MEKIKFSLFKVNGSAKRELMAQELTQAEIGVHLENGLRDLKRLVGLYVIDKKAEYRMEIGSEGLNFVGNKFAASLSTVLDKIAAFELNKAGKGAELRNIEKLSEEMAGKIEISPEVLKTIELADKVLEGNMPALEQLTTKLIGEPKAAEND